MKSSLASKFGQPLFKGFPFAERFSYGRIFFILLFLLLLGCAVGAVASESLELFEGQTVLALLFSGIPSPELGFFSCFSTILINTLIGLVSLFLLGVTAFGTLAAPVLIFFRGVTLGLGVFSFLFEEGTAGLWHSALYYTPAAALASLLMLFFAVRALVFSDRLTKLSFSASDESLDFQEYSKDFIVFVSFAVAVSLAGGFLSVLYAVFF